MSRAGAAVGAAAAASGRGSSACVVEVLARLACVVSDESAEEAALEALPARTRLLRERALLPPLPLESSRDDALRDRALHS